MIGDGGMRNHEIKIIVFIERVLIQQKGKKTQKCVYLLLWKYAFKSLLCYTVLIIRLVVEYNKMSKQS